MTTNERPSFTDRYAVLGDRNIFLSERRRPRDASTRPASAQSSAPAPETFVIRGIVLEDTDLRAYVESSKGGPMMRLAPGDTVGKGQVVEIQADAILFTQDGQPAWVEIGHDLLSGKQVTTVARPTTSASTTQPTAAGAAPGGSSTAAPATPSNLSELEQRMRARSRRNTGGQ